MEGNAKDLVLALEGLEREKNIKREDILKTVEDALVSALRKNLGKTAQISAKIDTIRVENISTGICLSSFSLCDHTYHRCQNHTGKMHSVHQ